MTTEAFVPSTPKIINGTGPYPIGHAYSDIYDIRAVVVFQGQEFPLSHSSFDVDPIGPADNGNITLTPAVATAYAGGTLHIIRDTAQEQGWIGNQGAREKGQENQMDRTMRAIQDVAHDARRSPKLPETYTGASPKIPPAETGKAWIWDANGNIANGPDADDIALAQEYAARAEAASSTVRPLVQSFIVVADFQPLPADNLTENPNGHDQVAVVQAILDGMAEAHPHAFALFVDGDVVDQGGIRDTNPENYYLFPDFIKDATERLAIPPDLVRMISGNHDRNYGAYDGQSDGDTFNNATLALGPSHRMYVDGNVMHLCMGDTFPDTQGGIPRHVRDWFAQCLAMGNAAQMPIFVHTHQPLRSIGLASADGVNGSQADSDWFKALISEPGYSVTAWFSGHVGGSDGETNNHAVFAGCHFFDVNLGVPGAYNAATGVPLWNLSYCEVMLTDGSPEIVIRRYDSTLQEFRLSDEVRITHRTHVRTSNIPAFDGRWAQDRSGIIDGFLQNPIQLVTQHPKEPASKITLGTNPLATVAGQKTVTVTHASHGYGDQEEVEFSAMPADLNGIPQQSLSGFRQVTVVDANTYTFQAGQAATSTGTGGTGARVTAEVKALVSEPNWAVRSISWLMQGIHAVGMGAGYGIYLPYTTHNGGAGPGTAEDIVFQRGFAGGVWGKLLNLATRATSLVLTASTGPQKSDRVDVLELHPTEGPKDLLHGFQYQSPVVQVTEQDDIDLATAAVPYYFAAMSSPNDINVGGYYHSTDASIRGTRNGDIFGISAEVSIVGTLDGTLTLYLEHWSDAVGTVKTIYGRSNNLTIPLTPIRIGAGERVRLCLDGHGPGTTLDITRTHLNAILLSRGNF